MEEFENKNGTDNHVSNVDELGKEMLLAQKEKYVEELDNYYDQVINITKSIENYNDQWIIDKELMKLQYDNFGKDESQFTHKVHKIPRYWELEKEKFSYTIRQEEFKAKSYFDEQEAMYKVAIARIESITKNLDEVSKRLEE